MERGSMHHIALSDATYKRKEGSSTARTIPVGLAGQHSAVTQRPGWAPDTAGESTQRHPGEVDARMGDSSDDEYLDPDVVSL